MSQSLFTTVIFGNQNQQIKLENSFTSFCQKLKQAFQIDWNITSLQCCDKEINEQISYDEYIKNNRDNPIEIKFSYDILNDYIEDRIKEYLDNQYDNLFSSIRDYIKNHFNIDIITPLNKTLRAITIEPNYSKLSSKSIQDSPKIEKQNSQVNSKISYKSPVSLTQDSPRNKKQEIKKVQPHLNNISNQKEKATNNITSIRDNKKLSQSLNNSVLNDSSFVQNEQSILKDNFRKELQTGKKNHVQIRKNNNPTKIVMINNPVDISPSAFLNEIDKHFKIYKKFADKTIRDCYTKDISEENYLNNLYKNTYVTLDSFSFEKI